ncbi:helix-turn-helix domain-containing protein [Paenibacillus odorifer]|uniref:helix-turn-helix domain-containing protein n=1 Tax=Paenibacillus odorifer TaxID=189426 RepID=UPI00096E3EA5|nr:helix-turn-helix transcriptional regulator [Paenibacillus odorifer]OME12786.1 hypothetical protein BSK60_16925 [Paenibacillus odorifer]
MFAERLKELREERRYSQKKLSEMLNLSQPYYGRFERSTGEPNLQTLIKLSKILNVSVDYLLGLTDEQKMEEITSIKDDSNVVQRNVTVVDGLEIEVIVRRKEKSPIPCQED